MLKFFRTIRKKLVGQSKFRNYALYAIGEIILVVIGILLALQINNWNEEKKNVKRENAFLINIYEDLHADSLRLVEIKATLETAVTYKRVFENYIKGNQTDIDSLNAHFLNQYNILVDFIPNSTTMDELTNGNGLNLISNPELRRKIVTLYNNYNELVLKLVIGQGKGQSVVNYVSQKVNNINSLTGEEVRELLEDGYYINQTRMNYLVTQLEAVDISLQLCLETIKLVQKEIKDA
jgi:hypothetical protein